jgi:hypothetical protein
MESLNEFIHSMNPQAWLTLALVCMAFIQAMGTIFNAFEVRERKKVAEKQLNLEQAKFNYKKELDKQRND